MTVNDRRRNDNNYIMFENDFNIKKYYNNFLNINTLILITRDIT
jgi:hypothetical protein